MNLATVDPDILATYSNPTVLYNNRYFLFSEEKNPDYIEMVNENEKHHEELICHGCPSFCRDRANNKDWNKKRYKICFTDEKDTGSYNVYKLMMTDEKINEITNSALTEAKILYDHIKSKVENNTDQIELNIKDNTLLFKMNAFHRSFLILFTKLTNSEFDMLAAQMADYKRVATKVTEKICSKIEKCEEELKNNSAKLETYKSDIDKQLKIMNERLLMLANSNKI